jgi:hypothetical protein
MTLDTALHRFTTTAAPHPMRRRTDFGLPVPASHLEPHALTADQASFYRECEEFDETVGDRWDGLS